MNDRVILRLLKSMDEKLTGLNGIDEKLSEIIRLLKKEEESLDRGKKIKEKKKERLTPQPQEKMQAMVEVITAWSKLNIKQRGWWKVYVRNMPQRDRHKIPYKTSGALIKDRRKPLSNGRTAFIQANGIAYTHGLSIPRLEPPSLLPPPAPPQLKSISYENERLVIRWTDPEIISNVKGIISIYLEIQRIVYRTIIANLEYPTQEELIVEELKVPTKRAIEQLMKIQKKKPRLTKDNKVALKYLEGRTVTVQMETIIVENDKVGPIASVGSNPEKIVIL